MTILSVTNKDLGAYVCSVKNLPGEDSALAVITVIDRLKFTLTPPLKVAASVFNNLMLNCKAQGALEKHLEEDQQVSSSYSRYFPKRNFVSQEGEHK